MFSLKDRLEGKNLTASDISLALLKVEELYKKAYFEVDYKDYVRDARFPINKKDENIIAIGDSQISLSLGNDFDDKFFCVKSQKRYVSGSNEASKDAINNYFFLGEGARNNNLLLLSSYLDKLRSKKELDFILPFHILTSISSEQYYNTFVTLTVDLTQNGSCLVNEAYKADFSNYSNGDLLKKEFEKSVNSIKNISSDFPDMLIEDCREHTSFKGKASCAYRRTFFVVNDKKDDIGYLVAGDLDNLRIQYSLDHFKNTPKGNSF